MSKEPLIGPRTCRFCYQFLPPRVRKCEHCGTPVTVNGDA